MSNYFGRYAQGRQEESDSETWVFILINKFDFVRVTL